MKSQHLFLVLLLTWICAAFTGCDDDSASSRITVTPASATIEKGQSIEFEASGGYQYTWSLDEDTAGAEPYARLSSRKGSRITYTSLRDGAGADEVRVLTVTSTIEEADATNSSPDEWTTEVYITHVSDGGDDDDTEALSLSPTSVTMATNDLQIFSASGGTGSYTWDIDPDNHGSLSSSSGNEVIFTASNVTTDSVTVVTVTSGDETANAIIRYSD